VRRTPLLLSAALVLLPLTALATSPSSSASGRVPADLALVRTSHSLLGSHQWYQQTWHGLPVLGGYYAVHETGGAPRVVDGRRAVTRLESAKAALGRGDAVAQASTYGVTRSARLVVVPGMHGARLAWRVETARDKRVLVNAAKGGLISVTDERRYADGTGQVFDPNPIVALQDESLTDQADSDAAVPAAAYRQVTLHHLDGNGGLVGDYAAVIGKGKYRKHLAFSPTLSFVYPRSDDRFEQVNAYYAVDTVQSYLQSLGFTGVNNEAQDLKVDQTKVDNSFYSPNTDAITFGTGGVDDAEDQEVVWHEYGHAVQDAQVPGFGTSEEAGAIGEGFGDYLAATMSQATSPDTATTPWVCVADWDSVSYTSTVPHCLRRLDTGKTVADKTGEVHDDGEIWSQALWQINTSLGRDTANRIIVEAQFGFAPDTSFAAAAQTTVQTADRLYGSSAADAVRAAFMARGIL